MRLRLATVNLMHGMSPLAAADGAPSPDRLDDALRLIDADVVAIQEVDAFQPRSGGQDQTKAVAGALDAPFWRFVPTVAGTPGRRRDWRPVSEGLTDPDLGHGGGPAYGIGLVSRLPVRRWLLKRFAAPPLGAPLLVPAGRRARVLVIRDEPRAALAAVIDGPGGPMSVISTHLSFVPGVNAWQLRAVASWARRELPAPRFLLGDLNLPGRLPAAISGWQALTTRPTWPSWNPRVAFDAVLADGGLPPGWSLIDSNAVTLPISDHCALVVDLG